MGQIEIKSMTLGMVATNCYLIINKENKEALLVDPADNALRISNVIEENGCTLKAILLTHGHFDHIGALRNFLTKRSIKIFKKSNLEEKEYNIGDFTFKCIYTPGHSADSVTFYFEEEKAMFVGDFIFKGSIGRCDLPTGDEKKMTESIQKIKTYSGDIEIYNGHGDKTTLKEEIENNIYFK